MKFETSEPRLDDIVKKYDDTYHSTIKMRYAYVKSRIYIGFGTENNDKEPKFTVDEDIRISHYEKGFAKMLCFKLERRSFCN